MRHDLKARDFYFAALLDGRLTFEVCKDDRGFKEGDELRLREIVVRVVDGEEVVSYTGRELSAEITYVTDFAQQPGFVVLGLVVGRLSTPQDRERPALRFLRSAGRVLAEVAIAAFVVLAFFGVASCAYVNAKSLIQGEDAR